MPDPASSGSNGCNLDPEASRESFEILLVEEFRTGREDLDSVKA
jgi:hypothetical protein